MRWLPFLVLLVFASVRAEQPDLRAALGEKNEVERYRLALEVLRKADDPSLLAKHQDSQVAKAAIDASRERLVDIGENATAQHESLVSNLLNFAADTSSPSPLASRALYAISESHASFGGRISSRVAELAARTDYPARLDAIHVLSELADGSQAATLAKLVNDPNPDVAAAASDGLESIKGKGVTDTFVKGIADKSLTNETRSALLRAATKREMFVVVPAAAEALQEPALRLEAQKALLRLARKSNLAELRTAYAKIPKDSATSSALARLIAKLEKE